MNAFVTYLRERALAAVLAAASAIVALELITPGIFDFVFDLILLGLIALVGVLSRGKK